MQIVFVKVMNQVFFANLQTPLAESFCRPPTKMEYIFGFSPTNSSIGSPAEFIFELQGNHLVFNIVQDMNGWVIREVEMLTQFLVGG